MISRNCHRPQVHKHRCGKSKYSTDNDSLSEIFRNVIKVSRKCFSTFINSTFAQHTRAHTPARTHTRACTHARTHPRACTRTHACTHARTYAHAHARTHKRTHAHTHTHTHTHTHMEITLSIFKFLFAIDSLKCIRVKSEFYQ